MAAFGPKRRSRHFRDLVASEGIAVIGRHGQECIGREWPLADMPTASSRQTSVNASATDLFTSPPVGCVLIDLPYRRACWERSPIAIVISRKPELEYRTMLKLLSAVTCIVAIGISLSAIA